MSSSRDRRRSIRNAAKEIISKIPNSQEGLQLDLPSVSSVPAYECFAERISESSAIEKFEEDARVGDILIVKVKRCDVVGAYVKPLCFATRIKRDLEWLDLQFLTPLSALSRRVAVGQYLEARICSVQPVKVELLEAPPLATNELPEYFRNGRDMPRHSRYWDYIEESGLLRNTYLAETLRFPIVSPYSFLVIEGLEKDRAEPASLLRKRQNEMLAEEYVVRGVEQMRSGNRESAIVVLNQALEINPHCVEALVARGAAYSTNGHYPLAEADFDKALELAPTHANARNYMVETLVKHASLLEVQGEVDNAKLKYEKVLRLKEDRRARTALAKLNKRKRSPSVEIVTLEETLETIEQSRKSIDILVENDRDKSRSRRSTREDPEAEKRKRRRTQEAERERKREREKLREMEEFIKALHRCICIHSSLQCLDLAMQSLLLNHGLLPCPLSLMPPSPPPSLVKTLNGISKVREVLQSVFRSRFRRSIREVALCVGPNPHRIVHAYKMPISICDAEDSRDECCGSPCSELSDVEKRRINRQLFLAFPPEEARHSGQRMFIFLRGYDSLVGEDIEESDVFFHDDKCSMLEFDHEGCSTPLKEPLDDVLKWMRIVPFIVHGKI
ncbi:unnamed protein product [Cylicocyclus nassatus]|uniref:Tetratricopeptide repeat protein 14 n=1 Tax=Cylicocyclus nassatus TaxID=53992 RepID=A0AA36GPJ6_CYLNA|nr:unnamed protein product [Cylicocyclus nassatus]